MESDLDKKFNDAFDRMSKLKKGSITQDTMLKLYAYNKQANFGNQSSLNSEPNVRNGFKFNAWVQLNGMSSKNAKIAYIELANTILNPKNQ
ncbi:acyl-CoA-binding protein [uncultured Polaribacter sp.]|uniref:acyl-CoA-binding protein n=1 Tax=uncultured Polaribacter sp. TaxID=174711 RepID=UPI002605CDA8|nr:acyl-CoA-binding protein [uncultured Polaribacter sp.]